MPLTPELTEFTTSSPFVASFDFTDIASGTGFQQYFLAQPKVDTTVSQILENNTIYSSVIEAIVSTASATFVKAGDLDFDLSAFNLTQTIRGTAVANISQLVSSSSGEGQMYLIIKVRKWDGSTETDLATAQTDTVTGTAGVGTGESITCVPLVIAETTFNEGDILRVTVEIWAKCAGTATCYVGCDPQNRDGTVITSALGLITKSNILIPYKVPN